MSCPTPTPPANWHKALNLQIAQRLKQFLGENHLGTSVVAQGFLWNAQTRTLDAAFGDVPPFRWAAQFVAGDGEAGHSFRFGRIVAWHRLFKQGHMFYLDKLTGL